MKRKKLLYISVNSKPEDLSASKTVARKLINALVEKYEDFYVEEIDLYKEHIPRLEYQYFINKNAIIDEEKAKNLGEHEQKEIQRIRELCDQFASADAYVIAAPMWSLSFPAPLKEYIDCILQDQKTISFDDRDKPVGLLADKDKFAIYVQSSGGRIPMLLRPVMNKGIHYVESIFNLMGISKFESLLVDGTGYSEEEKNEAIERAEERISYIIDYIKFQL